MNYSDILIIGAGPGGYETAVKARQLGKEVTLIEKDELGGTCLNRGCIPTKTLCRGAQLALLLDGSNDYGIIINGSEIDFDALMKRKSNVVESLRAGVESLLKGINLVKGEAEFLSSSEVSVNGEIFTAPTIIIATGSKPARLDIPGKELTKTSDEILQLESLPKSLAIIGGGVIGLEFASIFSALGVKVSVLEYCKEILPPFDAEIAKRLRMSLKRRGIDIITNAEVTSIEKGITVKYSAKGKEKSLEAEVVLMAVGREAVLPPGIENTGVKVSRGAIEVNDDMSCVRTALDETKLFAIGDVNRRCMLAHAATLQGEVALGLRRLTDVIPSAVFTHPECAMVGLTEDECAGKGLNIKIGKATFLSNGKAMSMGETEGLVKVIMDESSGRLLGCHICGPHAADIIQEAVIVMNECLPASAIVRSVHAHPTLSEAVKAAVPE